MTALTEDRRWLLLAALLIGSATAALIEAARGQGWLQPLELLGYDLGLALQPATRASTPITLIEITEADIQALGRWPVPDDALALALRHARLGGARVVGVDLYRDVAVPPGTAALDAELQQGNAVGIFKFTDDAGAGVAGHPVLTADDRIGFSDLLLDSDAIVRRGAFFMDDGETVFTAFSLRLALAYLAAEGIGLAPDPSVSEHFRIGARTFAPLPERYGAYADLDNAGYQFLMDFSRPTDSFARAPFAALLANDVPGELLRERIVLLGVHAESVKDSFVSPTSHWPWSAEPQITGVALHGLIVDQILRAARGESRAPTAWAPRLELTLIVAAALAGAFAGLLGGSAARLLLVVAAGSGLLTALGLVLFYSGRWFPVLPAALAWTVAASLTTAYLVQRTRRERAALQRILSLQISPTVAEAIWQRREELLSEGRLRPQNLTATVMFADLKGFTRLTEALPSDELVAWLDPIMRTATDIIIAHGGMVDDYFGDGVKANFGVPLKRSSEDEVAGDARNALRCAEALMAASARLNKSSEHPYVWRFGIHTGSVVAASVGSEARSKYTTIGDTVNVAARLEAVAKEQSNRAPDAAGQGPVIISEQTVALLHPDVEREALGNITLRGRRGTLRAFRIVTEAEPQRSELRTIA